MSRQEQNSIRYRLSTCSSQPLLYVTCQHKWKFIYCTSRRQCGKYSLKCCRRNHFRSRRVNQPTDTWWWLCRDSMAAQAQKPSQEKEEKRKRTMMVSKLMIWNKLLETSENSFSIYYISELTLTTNQLQQWVVSRYETSTKVYKKKKEVNITYCFFFKKRVLQRSRYMIYNRLIFYALQAHM